MNTSLHGLLAVMLISTVVGCTTTLPENSTFILRHSAEPGSQQINPRINIGLGRITIPAYLNQSGIILVGDQHEIHAANNNHWAEPLDQGIRNYLKSAISTAAEMPIFTSSTNDNPLHYKINIEIVQFHGTLDGKATLVCHWRIADPSDQQPTKRFEFSATETLQSSGYPVLITSEMKLLDQLASTIAEQIKVL